MFVLACIGAVVVAYVAVVAVAFACFAVESWRGGNRTW
jgi:hypothetical protein